jgi:hypothetical protein
VKTSANWKYCHNCQRMGEMRHWATFRLTVVYLCPHCDQAVEIPKARTAKEREGEERAASH